MNETCQGCSMEGNSYILATHSFEKEESVQGPCPDVYEYSLKGTSCLVLHWVTKTIKYNLCDKHYKMYQKYNQSNTITYR